MLRLCYVIYSCHSDINETFYPSKCFFKEPTWYILPGRHIQTFRIRLENFPTTRRATQNKYVGTYTQTHTHERKTKQKTKHAEKTERGKSKKEKNAHKYFNNNTNVIVRLSAINQYIFMWTESREEVSYGDRFLFTATLTDEFPEKDGLSPYRPRPRYHTAKTQKEIH